MKKPYCGNEKPYILALFHESDRQRVMPILEKLEKTGLEQYGFDGKIRKHKAAKSCAFVAFISEHFAEDPERMAMIGFAKLKKSPLIAVRMDGIAEWPESLKEPMEAIEADGLVCSVEAEDLSPEDLSARITQADVLDPPAVTDRQKKCARIRRAILSCTILAVIIAGVVSFGVKTQGWFSPAAKRMMLHSWMRGDLTILEQLLH